MNAFTIKDLENLSGIKAHTIRIWEQRYAFIKPQRTQTNIRYYSNDELKKILNISLLNKYGFKISHINKMSPAEIHEKIVALSNVQAQQERIVNDMIQFMVDMNVDAFEEVLDNYIAARGFDKAITQIIFPFLERIGILWVTDHINPAQEHLVSNIIRQKLIAGIETVFTHISTNKLVLLFLPEGEHHELGLLYICFLLKSRGIKTLYLGANVPMADLEFVCKVKKPDYLYTHITSATGSFNFEKFLHQAHTRMEDFPMIISGQLTASYKKQLPPKISFKTSLQEVIDYISVI
ncbi:MAG TPA: MerR family transcriptional regulator [Chitinophagaceae bacterium]|nr:MerR family transcriptional regulator [Chitinophagaceae bacterium]